MLDSLTHAETWVALLQICIINILLSGDNAVVIALACRDLPEKQQKQAFAIGAAGVIVLMTALTAAAAYLLSLPYLEVIGSALLLWIGVKLLSGDSDGGEVEGGSGFWDAVRIIIVADIVMSLDNVIAVAAIAQGSLTLLTIGLVASIPIIIAGAALIMAVIERFPIFVWAGAALLGWIAGDIVATDPAIVGFLSARFGDVFVRQVEIAASVATALLVVGLGGLWQQHPAARVRPLRPRRRTGDAERAGERS